ncbi:hypothetical protein GGX14DRAFT_566684 [Mycena pura]|uniref:Nephrocystin 3-like N-terminal domain-containing protein n=1 Tax=Mycena pura TaxID=153505 RepID=A0AAD6VCK7_9AGAR|nr:hypothetical protein GGX14DRAFT_566684 [Mycena pura]
MAAIGAAAVLEEAVPTYLGDHQNISIAAIAPAQYGDTIYDPIVVGHPPVRESISTNTYTRIDGNMTQLRVTSYGESGLDILYRFIAMGAVHDSGERFADPACHPGTRVAVLEHLSAWSNDTRPESSILWIAQMFAGDCKNKNRLGASFFFKRGHPERGSWHRLFTTIAYQLAISVPGLSLHVQHAVEANKLVVSQAKELQFQLLIVEPLKRAPVPELLPILILDGLDECEDYKIQQEILRLFIDVIRVQRLPLRILIASRPEPHICGVIQTKETFNICRLMELRADDTAYEDIRRYLKDEFSKIHSEYIAEGMDLGAVWPPHEAVEHLVQKSSGIFIYAATVIRFVGDQYTHPQEQLDSVLGLDPESTCPLDDLYTEILSVAKQNDRQLRILHVIWRRTFADPEEIDLLLDLSRGTSRLALRGWHSLLEVPPINTQLQFRWRIIMILHASFTDFLGDARRSKGWCVSFPWLHSDYLHSSIRLLSVPPSTHHVRALCCEIIGTLPEMLNHATPCDQLFGVLRNPDFQNSLFLTDYTPKSPWPHRGSQYPSDLIRLWECHRFLSTLRRFYSTFEENFGGLESSPTYKYDSLYTEILSGQSTLIFILSAKLLVPGGMYPTLRLFDLTYRIFEPFFAFRDRLDLPISEGDSLLAFIADPDRAGPLYLDPQDTAEVLILRWITRAREFMVSGDFWLDP